MSKPETIWVRYGTWAAREYVRNPKMRNHLNNVLHAGFKEAYTEKGWHADNNKAQDPSEDTILLYHAMDVVVLTSRGKWASLHPSDWAELSKVSKVFTDDTCKTAVD